MQLENFIPDYLADFLNKEDDWVGFPGQVSVIPGSDFVVVQPSQHFVENRDQYRFNFNTKSWELKEENRRGSVGESLSSLGGQSCSITPDWLQHHQQDETEIPKEGRPSEPRLVTTAVDQVEDQATDSTKERNTFADPPGTSVNTGTPVHGVSENTAGSVAPVHHSYHSEWTAAGTAAAPSIPHEDYSADDITHWPKGIFETNLMPLGSQVGCYSAETETLDGNSVSVNPPAAVYAYQHYAHYPTEDTPAMDYSFCPEDDDTQICEDSEAGNTDTGGYKLKDAAPPEGHVQIEPDQMYVPTPASDSGQGIPGSHEAGSSVGAVISGEDGGGAGSTPCGGTESGETPETKEEKNSASGAEGE